MGEHGDKLDANFGALLIPDTSAWEKIQKAFDLAAALSREPGAAIAVKTVAFARAWFFDGKKPDRIFPVLLGLKERIEKLEATQKEYLRTDEAQATFEEAFARIADQPDGSRRETMQRILCKILERPRDSADNKLFLRLADELPGPALKLLAATHTQAEQGVRMSTRDGLARYSGVPKEEVESWIAYLVSQGLFDEKQLGRMQAGSYDGILTRLGREFENYCRG